MSVFLEGSIHLLPGPATPLSPDEYRIDEPIIPSFAYSVHCLAMYLPVSSTSGPPHDVLTTYGGLTTPQVCLDLGKVESPSLASSPPSNVQKEPSTASSQSSKPPLPTSRRVSVRGAVRTEAY